MYEGSIDNVIGILYLNHFLKAMADDGRVDIRKLLMPPCYVYKTMKLPAVLNTLRKAKQHLAIVSDEYGGTLGVVSMEDVLEQIVGDIWDESDVVEHEVVQREKSEYELDGAMILSDFPGAWWGSMRMMLTPKAIPSAAGRCRCSAASRRRATASRIGI
ncbi:MAG: CBS domain-containing protein [Oscillospiraceae bacterium]